MTKLKIDIGYSTSYSSTQFDEVSTIAEQIFEIKKYKVKQKSLDQCPLIILSLLGPPFAFFSRGFFAKLGDRLGDEAADEIIKIYRMFKVKLASTIFSKKSSMKPTLSVEFAAKNKPQFIINIKPKSEKILIEILDDLEAIYKTVTYHIAVTIRTKVKKISITLTSEGKDIKTFYCIDNNNEIYAYRK